MRKKSLTNFFDLFIWFIILALPLIMFCGQYAMYRLNTVTDIGSLSDYIINNFGLVEDSFIYNGFASIFGSNGVIQLLDTSTPNALMLYLTYFVIVELVHLIVDFLVFIPRLCHKWMHMLTKDE